jgi:hypothetical protein
MAHVTSTAHAHEDVPVTEGESAVMERAAMDEGCDSVGSAERTESVQASDEGSHNCAEGDSDEGFRTRCYYFGPLTVTVSHIREMIDHGYFAEGGAHASGEETILELDSDEVVVFEEFFLRLLEDASTSDSHRYTVEISSATPSTYPQHRWAAVEIYLGSR